MMLNICDADLHSTPRIRDNTKKPNRVKLVSLSTWSPGGTCTDTPYPSDFPRISKPPFVLSDSYENSPRRSHLAQAGGSALGPVRKSKVV